MFHTVETGRMMNWNHGARYGHGYLRGKAPKYVRTNMSFHTDHGSCILPNGVDITFMF